MSCVADKANTLVSSYVQDAKALEDEFPELQSHLRRIRQSAAAAAAAASPSDPTLVTSPEQVLAAARRGDAEPGMRAC